MTSLFRQISAVVAMTIGGLPSRFWGSVTTIFSIAPSPKDANVIWTGSDDGYVQITKDGGKTWEQILTVSDKTGAVEFARGLRELDIDLISTGGKIGRAHV